jgi:hypothetical protein
VNVVLCPLAVTVVDGARNNAKLKAVVPETGIGTPPAEMSVDAEFAKLTVP